MNPRWVTVLPSRDEAATIAAVAEAADIATDGRQSLLVNVDHSRDETTQRAFERASLRARRCHIRSLQVGKGAQVIRGMAETPGPSPLLIIDTDTRNPSPARYTALIKAVEDGADVAIAHYRRHWFEANLTSHLARPLIAATVGIDLPQPIAGDIAISVRAAKTIRSRYDALAGHPLRKCVDGYGIDAFIVLVNILAGHNVQSVPLEGRKEHAPSFPHLPRIYHDAVPVLLTNSPLTNGCPMREALNYELEPTILPDASLRLMQRRLAELRPPRDKESALVHPWPTKLAQAWQSVQRGADPFGATEQLWPAYLDRVASYLNLGSRHGIEAARATLTASTTALSRYIRDWSTDR